MNKIISKLHQKCEKCPHVNDCDEKRMIACGLAERPQPIFETASQAMTMPIAAEIMVKHDYRDIKISPTQTVTVDLEEMKKDIERRLYKALGCPAFQFGA